MVTSHPALFQATGYAHHPYGLLSAPDVRTADPDFVTMSTLDRLTKTLDKAVPASGLLSVSQVCSSIRGARGNDSLSPSTVTRWILTGCPARSGARVKLVATRVGSRWMVSPAALEEFFTALASTTPAAPSPPTTKTRTDAQRRAACEAATKELERRGA